jgi:hypothetical protein
MSTTSAGDGPQASGPVKPMDTNQSGHSAHELHLNLINFLFSLSIGRVAIEVSRILHNANARWLEREYWPSYTHLAVGSLVIILSWLGWRNSHYAAKAATPVTVFSRSFVELCIDLALVVLYFRLVSSAEGAEFGIGSPANAIDEAGIIAAIFTLYCLWDVVTKWRVAERAENGTPDVLWARMQVSVLTMLLSWGAAVMALFVPASAAAICFFDVGIMGLAVFFREGKAYVSKSSTDLRLFIAAALFLGGLFLAIRSG